MKALIVDDEPVVRMLASKMLEVKGYSVETAFDEASLKSYLDSNTECPDLIMLDLQIGDLMGPDALFMVKSKFKPLKKLICMSSHASHEVEDLFPTLVTQVNLETNFLQKPFQSADLYKLL